MPEKIEIGKTELDEDFRRKVRTLLDSAKREIVIITGEGAAFGFQDLRYATERAVERGAEVKIYSVSPVPEFLNKVLTLGCSIYRGKRKTKDHYLVIDGRDWVISREHPTADVGRRRGELHLNDRKGARKILGQFRHLIEEAEEIKTPAWDSDPLIEAVERPRSWGVRTDAKRFREELFG